MESTPETPTPAPPPAEPQIVEREPSAEAEGGEPAPPSAGDPGAAPARGPVAPKRGQKIVGRIAQIGPNGVFVDFGGREEGVLDPAEIRDEQGALTKAVGDEIRATVLSTDAGVKLTLKGKRPGNLPALLEAHRAGASVEGKVTGVNKGGLVVRVMGLRAFCPYSQIDRRYIENPDEYIGKKLTFRVSSADDKGRNVILSRRALLDEDARGKAETLRRDLAEGAEMTGTIARIRPFGAFVDLGGVDGMIHVSEISHARVRDPSEVLKVGQEVRVRVVKVENLGAANERISLSMKRLESDPWDTAVGGLSPGDRVEGKVVRVAEFGAFVELAPGVDGLVHVSALAAGRVGHPSEIVNVGDAVHAWVVQVDRERHRVSLSLVDPMARRQDRPEHSEMFDPPARSERSERRPRRRDQRPPKVHRSSDHGGGDELTSMGEAFRRMRERQDED
ncbi:MAG: 30S ribosomal protein S1 [Candidatus Eiseniibacteriota bacterium]